MHADVHNETPCVILRKGVFTKINLLTQCFHELFEILLYYQKIFEHKFSSFGCCFSLCQKEEEFPILFPFRWPCGSLFLQHPFLPVLSFTTHRTQHLDGKLETDAA